MRLGPRSSFFPGLDFGLVTFGNMAVTSNSVGLFALWQLVDERLRVLEEERFDWEATCASPSSFCLLGASTPERAKATGDRYRGFNEDRDAMVANCYQPDLPSPTQQPHRTSTAPSARTKARTATPPT